MDRRLKSKIYARGRWKYFKGRQLIFSYKCRHLTFDLVIENTTPLKLSKKVVLLNKCIAGGPEYSYWHQYQKPFCGPSLAFKNTPDILS